MALQISTFFPSVLNKSNILNKKEKKKKKNFFK